MRAEDISSFRPFLDPAVPLSIPDPSPQLELITVQATRAGFTGGVVVDFPNSAKAKK